jgi:hypothetical protein
MIELVERLEDGALARAPAAGTGRNETRQRGLHLLEVAKLLLDARDLRRSVRTDVGAGAA